jgi:hypothetical protein
MVLGAFEGSHRRVLLTRTTTACTRSNGHATAGSWRMVRGMVRFVAGQSRTDP